MPTDKPRITFMLEEDVLAQLRQFQADNDCNQSQAIIALISKGLAIEASTIPVMAKKSFDIFELKDVSRQYRELDDFGKRAVSRIIEVEYARCMAQYSNTGIHPTTVTLRRYNNPAAAGTPLFAESDYTLIDYPIDKVPEGTSFAVGICGDSMHPKYPDGSTVFVKNTGDIHNNDVVIVWIEGEGTVCKRLICDPSGRVSALRSDNHTYSDITGNCLTDMRIYGKVVGIFED